MFDATSMWHVKEYPVLRHQQSGRSIYKKQSLAFRRKTAGFVCAMRGAPGALARFPALTTRSARHTPSVQPSPNGRARLQWVFLRWAGDHADWRILDSQFGPKPTFLLGEEVQVWPRNNRPLPSLSNAAFGTRRRQMKSLRSCGAFAPPRTRPSLDGFGTFVGHSMPTRHNSPNRAETDEWRPGRASKPICWCAGNIHVRPRIEDSTGLSSLQNPSGRPRIVSPASPTSLLMSGPGRAGQTGFMRAPTCSNGRPSRRPTWQVAR